MKIVLFCVFITVVSALSPPVLEDIEAEWKKFKETHGKVYKSRLEERTRKSVFAKNYDLIRNHNEKYDQGEVSYFLKLNKFADKTFQERKALKGYKRTLRDVEIDDFVPDPNANIPDQYDWRDQGAVTAVKDQGDKCGSCWAFSTTGSLEGQYFLSTGNLVSLSEQNLIDCSTDNDGCDGGDMPPAFTYIYSNDGIDSEESYPYTAADGTCQYNVANNVTSLIGYSKIKSGSESDLKAAVATIGPISVAIDASHEDFDYYGGGIYQHDSCSTNDLDHAVLAVGYGKNDDDTHYWIVKNSWGADWGEKGYIKMLRNKENNCGIATEGCFPLMY